MSLTEMRKNSGSFITYLLFGMIIVVFIFTFNTVGPDEACGGTPTPGGPVQELAEVGGVTVDTNMLRMAQALVVDPPPPRSTAPDAMQRDYFYRMMRYAQSPLRGPYSDLGVNAFPYTPIEAEKAMNLLIETNLVAAEAEKMGLVVSDHELADRILGDDFFDPETGEFDKKSWENWIRYNVRTSPPRFEEFLRRELLREKLIAVMVGQMTVPDQELKLQNRLRGEKVELEFIDVDPTSAAALLKVDPEGKTTWLQEHQDEVKKYYEDHPDEFNKPERVALRGIRFNAPNRKLIGATKDEARKKQMQDERGKARAKAEGVLANLQKQGDAKPAEGDAKPAEGDAKPAEGDAKPAEGDAKPAEGDAKPAEGDAKPAEGDAKPAEGDTKPTEGDAKPAEGDAKPAEPAEKPEGFVPVAPFAEAAKANSDDSSSKVNGGLLPKPRSRDDLKRYPYGDELAEAAFALKPGQMSAVVEVDSGFWIVRLEEKLPAQSRSLDQAREEIADKLYRAAKAEEFREELSKEVLAKAKEDPKQGLEKVAEALNAKYGAKDGEGLMVEKTGKFARVRGGMAGSSAGTVPSIGEAPELMRAAFAASEESPLLGQVFKGAEDKHLVVARFIGRDDAPEMTEDELKAEREGMIRERQDAFYTGWLKDLVATARAEGRVEETDAWAKLLDEQYKAYAEAGGQILPPKPAGAEAPEGVGTEPGDPAGQ